MNKKEYLEKQQKLKDEFPEDKLISVDMPSGDTWKHIPFDFTQYAIAAQFPLHLIGKLRSVRNAPQKEMSEEELEKIGIASMRIVADVLLNKLVSPKVTAIETDDSLTADQLNEEDFEFFKNYVMSGGQVSQNSFRKQSA
jgi:hypothetical protein